MTQSGLVSAQPGSSMLSHISQIKMDIDKRIYNIENAFPRAEYSESKANK
jgi:hypothetical protein